MDRYQLATLVKWAGDLKSRKRLQKVVYLLQAAGCDLDVDYTLHHYGPYSHDLASLTDQMVQAELLDEEEERFGTNGRSFNYKLPERVNQQIEDAEKQGQLRARIGALGGYEACAKKLLAERDPRKLELAATVAYYQQRNRKAGWDDARDRAARFKAEDPSAKAMVDAVALAREIVEQGSSD